MSSRIVRGSGVVEPVMWRSLGEAARHPAAPQAGAAFPVQSTRPAPAPSEERLAALERDARARQERAFSEGYAKGEAAGRAAEGERIETAAAALAQAAADIAETRRKLRRECEEDCVKLSVAIARRVLHRELSVDSEAMLGIVKAALARLEGREVDRIRTHPDDASLIQAHLERTAARTNIQVLGDAGVARGTCVFETARGNLDASIETQLTEIQRGLVDRIR